MTMKFKRLILFLIGFLITGSTSIPTKIKNENSNSGKLAEENSDMLMEPNEYSRVTVVKSESRQVFPTLNEYRNHYNSPDLNSEAAQNYYPPYYKESQPLGHSRPYYPNSDGPISRKFSINRSFDPSILGSGDFGLLRGGTFYNAEEIPYHNENNDPSNYYFGDTDDGDNNNNGHGRPQAEALIQRYTYPEEQFANFRDFADINTPDPAYSQFVIVYTNKNSTSNHPGPKNIFEQLELLDKEKAKEEKKNHISKTKVKLANTKLEKNYKKKVGPKDLDYEPLLALS